MKKKNLLAKFNVYKAAGGIYKTLIAEDVTLDEAKKIIDKQPMPMMSGLAGMQEKFIIENRREP